MKKILLPLIVVLSIGVLIGLFFIYNRQSTVTIDQVTKPTVVASIFPLYDLVKNVAGEELNVALILPPGASPHTFEITPEQVKIINRASLIFKIGVIDDWLNQTVTITDAQVVTVNQNIDLKRSNDEDEPDVAYDPHFWLNPLNTVFMVDQIVAELSMLAPENAEKFHARGLSYQNELKELDKDLAERLSQATIKKMITFHNGWSYFADRYGLEVIATFEPSPGKEPTPRLLQSIIELTKANNLKTIYSEPQLATDSLSAILDDLDLELLVLDPLGGVPGTMSYLELMKYNANVLDKGQNLNTP